MSTEPVSEGKRLVEAWQEAERHFESLKMQLQTAEGHFHNARNALGKWLMPHDAARGEMFSIWYGNSLITAKMDLTSERNFSVSVRKRDKDLR